MRLSRTNIDNLLEIIADYPDIKTFDVSVDSKGRLRVQGVKQVEQLTPLTPKPKTASSARPTPVFAPTVPNS